MAEHLFYVACVWMGILTISLSMAIALLWTIGKAVDWVLDLLAIRAAVCFYILHRQAIRKAIGEDPQLKTLAERWHEKWRNQSIF